MFTRSGTLCLWIAFMGMLALGVTSCTADPAATDMPTAAATRPPATRLPEAQVTPAPTGAVSLSTPAPSPAATTFVHRVQRGEMLKDIARQYGCTVDELIALNQIEDPDLIKVGQEILIPAGGTSRQPAAVCTCLGNLYNCDDFGTQAAAQACFAYCRSVGQGDCHRLDQDGSGLVCRNLP